jgi:hypothetical protein
VATANGKSSNPQNVPQAGGRLSQSTYWLAKTVRGLYSYFK